MKLVLEVTAAQSLAAKEVLKADHVAFYAQPHGFRRTYCPAAYELFAAPAGTLNTGYNETSAGLFGWVTGGGNVVLFNPTEGTVTYVGTRHGIAPLWVLEKPNSHKVVSYESSMPFLAPFETLANFVDRARLDSDCPIARGIALLKSGKPLAFLHAEGLPVRDIKKVFIECFTRGYFDACPPPYPYQ